MANSAGTPPKRDPLPRQVPTTQERRPLEGYEVQKNGHFMPDAEFATADAAKAFVGSLVPYPIEWDKRGADADGQPRFHGAHPAVMAQYRRSHLRWLSPDQKRDELDIAEEAAAEEFGFAVHDLYDVEPRYDYIDVPIEDAEYIDDRGSSLFYVKRISDTLWEVKMNGVNTFFGYAPTRRAAVAKAWRLTEQHMTKSPSENSITDYRVFGSSA